MTAISPLEILYCKKHIADLERLRAIVATQDMKAAVSFLDQEYQNTQSTLTLLMDHDTKVPTATTTCEELFGRSCYDTHCNICQHPVYEVLTQLPILKEFIFDCIRKSSQSIPSSDSGKPRKRKRKSEPLQKEPILPSGECRLQHPIQPSLLIRIRFYKLEKVWFDMGDVLGVAEDITDLKLPNDQRHILPDRTVTISIEGIQSLLKPSEWKDSFIDQLKRLSTPFTSPCSTASTTPANSPQVLAIVPSFNVPVLSLSEKHC